jgi:glycosyltransferase involved in cell wall biosynthesis
MSRVVHIVSHIGTYGGERFVAALVRAQRAAGTNAGILTIYDSPSLEGVDVYSAGRRRAYAPGGGFGFFFRLVKLLQRLEPDIAHTHLAHAKYWGRLAALAARIPHLVHTEHSNDFTASLPRRALTRLLHARTERVVAFTQAHAQRIVRYEGVSPERLTVIANGIESVPAGGDRQSARSALGIAPASHAIFFIGRLDPVKSPMRAIAALALFPLERNVHLYFAGNGPLREAMREYARRLDLVDRVHVLGYRSDVGTLLSAADAVINTSESEAMPLSLIEALCAGLPVICTPWPGARELLKDAGSVADSFEPAAIACRLEAVLRPTVRAAPEATQALRERFSITRAALQYSALYEELLQPDRVRHASPIPSRPELSGLPQ